MLMQCMGLMIQSITGYPVVEFRVEKAKSPSCAWEELEDFYVPQTIAVRHRLKREFRTVRMMKGEGIPL